MGKTFKELRENRRIIGSVAVDEISIKDLTKAVANSSGNKNLHKALKKSRDQTKQDLAALRKKLQMSHTEHEGPELQEEAQELDEAKIISRKPHPDGGHIIKLKTDGGQTVTRHLKNGKVKTMKVHNESVELEENKALMKDYQGLKAKGKTDSHALDYLMSMPKYKRMSKDDMRKIIGDAKRKGIFKEETLEENRVAALAKDFHNRLKKAGNSDRNQSRERYTTLAKAKKQGLSPIEMKQLDGKMNGIMNKMDESVNEISGKKYNAALKGREIARDRARNSAGANKIRGDDDAADADMAKAKTHDRKLKRMKQMGADRTRKTLTDKLDEAPRRKGAPKMTGDSIAIQRAKDAELNKALGRTKTGRKKPVRQMTSTQRSLAQLRGDGK